MSIFISFRGPLFNDYIGILESAPKFIISGNFQ